MYSGTNEINRQVQLECKFMYNNLSSMRDNLYYRMCLAVVFLPLIEKELGEFMHYWNTHCIRPSSGNCIGAAVSLIISMTCHSTVVGINYVHAYMHVQSIVQCHVYSLQEQSYDASSS